MLISATSLPSSAASSPIITTRIATPSTSGSSGDTHANDARWQVKYGFWNDLDVLYNDFPPPRKPRIPLQQQLDDGLEW